MKARGTRKAFSLMEVLFAIAIFGAATAALLSAMTPAYDELFRLSNQSATAGDIEVMKAMIEASPNYSTITQGGAAALPDGRKVEWKAELEPTSTEALFLVKLRATADNDTFAAEYLHFEPRWLQPGAERPRWLRHTSTTPSQGGGAPASGGGVAPGGGGNRAPVAPVQGGGQGQQGGQPGGGQPRGDRGRGGQGRGGQGGQAGPGGARGGNGGGGGR
jgi:type II secretion system protein I